MPERMRADRQEIFRPYRASDPADGDGKTRRSTRASALWMRPKNEITAEQYKEFYHHVAPCVRRSGADHPLARRRQDRIYQPAVRARHEAVRSVRSEAPARREALCQARLHHRRAEGWCRRICVSCKGVVDSEDLPLNISREMLQNNPMLARIAAERSSACSASWQKRPRTSPKEYAKFWDNFGVVLKEGLYEDREHRDGLLPLVRFRSTGGEGLFARRLCRRA